MKRKPRLPNARQRGRKANGPSGPKVADWGPAFLSALCETGQVGRAAEAAQIVYNTAWRRRKDDPEFEAAYQDALKISAGLLEAEAVRRAKDGLRRMKFNAKTGEAYIDPGTGQPYVEHEYSDTLMLALLKRHFPELYRERQDVNLSGQIDSHIAVTALSEDKWLAMLEKKQAAIARRHSPKELGNGEAT